MISTATILACTAYISMAYAKPIAPLNSQIVSPDFTIRVSNPNYRPNCHSNYTDTYLTTVAPLSGAILATHNVSNAFKAYINGSALYIEDGPDRVGSVNTKPTNVYGYQGGWPVAQENALGPNNSPFFIDDREGLKMNTPEFNGWVLCDTAFTKFPQLGLWTTDAQGNVLPVPDGCELVLLEPISPYFKQFAFSDLP